MAGLCEGRVAIVTGGGRGIGREYCLMLAAEGAKVVVNDLGGSRDGSGADIGPAHDVVAEIKAAGGEAVANGADVSNWDQAKAMIDQAVQTFGKLDVLINNAGILRDRTLANMSEDDWDSVIRVHMRGTFAPSRHAAAYWRDEAKAGRPRVARLINTSSSSGIYCNPGQANYGAAKAGIAAMSVIAARELERYGVTVNAIYPTAMSRLTEDIFSADKWVAIREQGAAAGFDPLDATNIAPLVVWLGSEASNGISGRVFGMRGGRITVAEGWHAGPRAEKQGRWEMTELDATIPELVRQAAANADTAGEIPKSVA